MSLDPNKGFTPKDSDLEELLESDNYAPFTYSRADIAGLLNEELECHPDDYEDVDLFEDGDPRLTDELCYKIAVSFCWNTEDQSKWDFNDCKWSMLEDHINKVMSNHDS